MNYKKEQKWHEYKFNHSYSGYMKLERTYEEIKKENWYWYENNHNPKWREYKDRHGAPLLNLRVIDFFWYAYKANHGHTENRETKTLEEWDKDRTEKKPKSLGAQVYDCLKNQKIKNKLDKLLEEE